VQAPSSKSITSCSRSSWAAPGDSGKEAELEAERLWWSEASQRQVRELESTFGSAFRKTAEKLSSQLTACREELEALVETEKKQRCKEFLKLNSEFALRQDQLQQWMEAEKQQRQSALVELRNDLESQQAGWADPEEVQQVHRLLAKLRSEVDSLQVQMVSKDAALAAASAHQRSQVATLEGAVSDLRRELADMQERDRAARELAMEAGPQIQAVEATVTDLRRELSSALEREHLHGAQLEALACDLRRDVEALHAQAATQQRTDEELHRLREELRTLREGDLGGGLQEVTARVVLTEERLRREIEDARASARGTDANIHNAELMEAFDARGKDLAKSLEEERQQRGVEASVLRARLDSACGQLQELQASTQAAAAAARQSAFQETEARAQAVALSERLDGALEQLRDLQASAQATAASLQSASQQTPAVAKEDFVTLCDAVEALRGDVTALETASAPCANELAANTAGVKVVRRVEDLARDTLETQRCMSELRGDVELLLRRVQGDKEGPEGIPGLAARLDATDSEVQRLSRGLGSLSSRVDATECEVWRASRDTPALVKRMDVVEMDVKRLAHESEPTCADVAALKAELAALRVARGTEVGSAPASTAGSFEAAWAQLDANANFGLPGPKKAGPLSSRTSTASCETPAPESVLPPASGQADCLSRSLAGSAMVPRSAPLLSDDIRESIGRLVTKVNTTLTTARPTENGKDLNHALQAVQELRERNITLREENMGLVEELLAQQGPNSRGREAACIAPERQNSHSGSVLVSPQLVPSAVRPHLGVGVGGGSLSGSVHLVAGALQVSSQLHAAVAAPASQRESSPLRSHPSPMSPTQPAAPAPTAAHAQQLQRAASPVAERRPAYRPSAGCPEQAPGLQARGRQLSMFSRTP